jgi:hypothetical protein
LQVDLVTDFPLTIRNPSMLVGYLIHRDISVFPTAFTLRR